MQKLGLGSDGNIIKNVTVSATLPLASPGIAQGIVDLRDSGAFSLQLIARSLAGAFSGAVLIEASNNYSPPGGGTNLGQPPYAGDWTDVTALFTPAVTTPLVANGSQIVEPLTKPNGWRALRVTLTRVSGLSVVYDVWVCGKE